MWRTRFHTRRNIETAIARYIEGFYNPIRQHSSLAYKNQNQFERMAA
ncbi:hypothetical protein [uncultured Martelella sp.]|nr:hypothetical protein [uncultured Martelella sp.]